MPVKEILTSDNSKILTDAGAPFVVIYINKPWILQTSRFCSINNYEIYGCILLGIV